MHLHWGIHPHPTIHPHDMHCTVGPAGGGLGRLLVGGGHPRGAARVVRRPIFSIGFTSAGRGLGLGVLMQIHHSKAHLRLVLAPSCRSVAMKSARALFVCRVLALVAGHARAKRCSQKVINNAPSSCSFTSTALGQDVTLTQACVNNGDVIGNDVTSPYDPLGQPWYGLSKNTVQQFVKEVGENCKSFGYPNLVGYISK
jgi:hypothetical protein